MKGTDMDTTTHTDTNPAPQSHEHPQVKRDELYTSPIIAGRRVSGDPLTRLRIYLSELLTSSHAREEAVIDAKLTALGRVTRCNTIATVSPKGGVGKTTTSFLVGNVLAEHLKLRAVVVDANPDFGTLASLAPDERRADANLADLIHQLDNITSTASLSRYMSRMPTGLHLLGAPMSAEAMQQITTAQYGRLLDFLSRYYDAVILDLGTGITSELAQFAAHRADQLVVVTTPEWITSHTVLGALRYLESADATLVLNQAREESCTDWHVIDAHFRKASINRRVTLPYDEQLRTMLDTGTYTLDALTHATRMPIKQLGLAVAEQLR